MKIPEKGIAFFVDSLHRGERQGFDYFYYELYPALNYFAFRLLQDSRAAAGITDKAFIDLWYNRKSFFQYEDIKYRVYSYVRTECLNCMNRMPNPGKNIQGQKKIFAGPSFTDNILAEVTAEIHATIDSLCGDARIIFEMLYIQGKTVEAVALELRLTIDTVRVRKAQGLNFLQKKFGNI